MKAVAGACMAVALLATPFGCGGAPDAVVVQDAPRAVPLPDTVEEYTLSGETVSVEADVRAGASYTLRFPTAQGRLVFAPARPDASTVLVLVDTSSLQSSLGVVADVARSEFLHVDRHPTARFTSRSFQRQGELLWLFGEFEFHGTARLLQVPATLEFDACRVSINCAFTINRQDFGAVSEGSLEGLVSDFVEIRIAAELPRRGRPASCQKEQP